MRIVGAVKRRVARILVQSTWGADERVARTRRAGAIRIAEAEYRVGSAGDRPTPDPLAFRIQAKDVDGVGRHRISSRTAVDQRHGFGATGCGNRGQVLSSQFKSEGA